MLLFPRIKKYWGYYSTPSTPASYGPVIGGVLNMKIINSRSLCQLTIAILQIMSFFDGFVKPFHKIDEIHGTHQTYANDTTAQSLLFKISLLLKVC